MTNPKSEKLSWEWDGKTTEAPSSYSQQRLKAVKQPMSWGEDASTVARPAEAQLPVEAFRPELGEPHEAPSAGEEAPMAPPLVEHAEQVAGEAVPTALPAVPPALPAVPPAPAAVRPALPQTVPPTLSGAVPPALPRAARHPWRRWLLLAATVPVFYLLSYSAVRVAQKLQQPRPAQQSAPAAQLWSAIGEVLREALDELRSTPTGRPGSSETQGTGSGAR